MGFAWHSKPKIVGAGTVDTKGTRSVTEADPVQATMVRCRVKRERGLIIPPCKSADEQHHGCMQVPESNLEILLP
jgi:hypothetical protein